MDSYHGNIVLQSNHNLNTVRLKEFELEDGKMHKIGRRTIPSTLGQFLNLEQKDGKYTSKLRCMTAEQLDDLFKLADSNTLDDDRIAWIYTSDNDDQFDMRLEIGEENDELVISEDP